MDYKVNHYIYLLLLNTLLNLYSTQLTGVIALLDRLFTMNKEQVAAFQKLYTRFLNNIE